MYLTPDPRDEQVAILRFIALGSGLKLAGTRRVRDLTIPPDLREGRIPYVITSALVFILTFQASYSQGHINKNPIWTNINATIQNE